MAVLYRQELPILSHMKRVKLLKSLKIRLAKVMYLRVGMITKQARETNM